MRRVPFYEIDEEHVAEFEGVPFTGIAFEESEDGRLMEEVQFKDGLQDGLAREWYLNGQLCRQGGFYQGVQHGAHDEWYETGARKRHAEFELGVLLAETTWSESGTVAQEFVIDPASPNYRILEKLRLGEKR